MPDLKDKASMEFAKAITKVQEELVSQVMELRNQGLSRNEILLVLESLDMEVLVLDKLGLQADIDNLMLTYQRVLSGMEMTGTVTEEVLTALVRMDRATFMSEAGVMGNNIKKQLARGVLADATEKQIRDGILKGAGGTLRVDQAATLANTALNSFERSVTSEMTRLDPPTAKYVYQGVVDDKTRDICLEMISAGSMTKDEVESQFPGAFIDGGGFNCRHRWAKDTSVSDKLTDKKGAEKVISTKAKEGKWKKPQTYQEQVSG